MTLKKGLPSLQAHARIEFQLLEGAVLAIAAFNGLDMNGHTIKVKLFPSAILVILIHPPLVRSSACVSPHSSRVPLQVQRPVDESTLDLDVTLDALVCDGLNSSRLQAVVGFNASAEVKGQALSPFTANGTLHEEKIRETFARFGPIRSISFTPEAGRRAGHAQIGESLTALCVSLLCAVDVCVCVCAQESLCHCFNLTTKIRT